ncbi:Dicer-like protein 2 [Neonectria ditissima]|uniref:Dicer-like protein 2 n=1 Tax=Neonectria ditissima TaxID=78410 RepID=A0A0P7BGB5_9HYPO|nr:Dicer-like protein 2 [Neonectria ditissima]
MNTVHGNLLQLRVTLIAGGTTRHAQLIRAEQWKASRRFASDDGHFGGSQQWPSKAETAAFASRHGNFCFSSIAPAKIAQHRPLLLLSRLCRRPTHHPAARCDSTGRGRGFVCATPLPPPRKRSRQPLTHRRCTLAIFVAPHRVTSVGLSMESLRFVSSGESGDPKSLALDDPAGDEAAMPGADITETVSVVAADGSSGINSVSLVEPGAEAIAPDRMSSRAYQLEMLDQSLQRNVIVAMDTGSGKTQVMKLVWFLAPTVSLCEQQCEVIRLQNTSVPIKVLTGNDKLDSWAPETWDIILKETRIIVSTFQVLLDALSHGYVNMEMLALLVIDEGLIAPTFILAAHVNIYLIAHNCVGNSPGTNIMTKFYHTAKDLKRPVPAVLGLTASPIMRSDPDGIKVLEATLDSRCITPTLHRDELLRCVNKPELCHSEYGSIEFPDHTAIMKSLRTVYKSIDITSDPHMIRLGADRSERGQRDFRSAMMRYDTYTQNQLKGLWGRSKEILRELGPWAVDHYISKAIGEFLERVDEDHNGGTHGDKEFLANFLRNVSRNVSPVPPVGSHELSEKANQLIRELISAPDNVVGIVFVKERATVTIIMDLLTTYPAILEKYRIGTMVGTSNHHARNKNIYEFNRLVGLSALQNFRSGRINLLIATSVLEEGIDVPACNLVVCFDKPANLKSFIQRRGRARMKQSKLVLLLERSVQGSPQWEALEQDMKEQYQDDKQEQRRLAELEEEAVGSLSFVVESTGARLDFDNAKQHLEHFCRVLTQGEFIDSRPDYIIRRVSQEEDSPVTATVLLPSSLQADLRHAASASSWKSQKNATKDAAFHAYLALYMAGLLNDNLLPIKDAPPEDRVPPVTAAPPFNPWARVAQEWQGTGSRWVLPLSLHDEAGNLMGRYGVVLPVQLPQPRPIKIYQGWNVQWTISFGHSEMVNDAAVLPEHTSTLLALHFGHRWPVEDRTDHVVKFLAEDTETISKEQIGSIDFDPRQHDIGMPYLVRDLSKCPYEYTGILPSKPPIEQVQNAFHEYEKAPQDVPYLTLKKTTRRADFLHPVHADPKMQKQPASGRLYTWVFPLPWAKVDTIQKKFAQFGMLIPSITHELEVMMVANELSRTILKPVGITDLQLVIEALSSRSAAEPVDYERLEFLGDSILKFCVVVQASAKYLNWPEGYLSFFKDRQVSNARLLAASVDIGLPEFVLSKIFTAQKWRPIYTDDILGEEPKMASRVLPSKMLADVVEALIGASYQDGGIPKALKCISLFLNSKKGDKTKWYNEREGRDILFHHAAADVQLPPTMASLEDLIGYSFQKKSLLIEAMTHGSYSADTHSRSMERLEFLGDAVLDYIIVTKVFSSEPALANSRLHMIKTAMVNGDFLAFVCLNHSQKHTETIVGEDGSLETRETALSLWKFMRHSLPAIGIEQAAVLTRFDSLSGVIVDALANGKNYPWAALARLHPRKFYSDIFEALLGAVWIDSGSVEACEAVLRKFSILPYLERILRDNVHVQHPKEELTKLAVNEKINYRYEVVVGADGSREFRCTVQIGDQVVAKVEGGVDKEEVMTKAAEKAVRFLKETRMAVD